MASDATITLLGYVGRVDGLRTTNGGRPVLDFRMATNRVTHRGEERVEYTTWFNVSVYGSLATSLANHVRKGAQVYVRGTFYQRTYTDRANVQQTANEVEAETVLLTGAAPREDDRSARETPSDAPTGAAPDAPRVAAREVAPIAPRGPRQFADGIDRDNVPI